MAGRNSIDMTTGPFLKKIMAFALPLVVTGMLQMLYNAADVIVVGRFAGKESLAAVSSTGSLVNLVVNVFLGLSMGSGVVAARSIGANDSKAVHRCTHCAIAVSLISGFAVMAIGFFLSGRLLVLMDSPVDVLPLSTLYLKIYFLGAPGSLLYNFGASLVRATGDTKRPLVILFSTGLVNIALNLLLVIRFSMGVAGVAIATVVSQYLSAALVVLLLLKMDGASRLIIRKIGIYTDELKKILYIGIPAGIQNSLFSLSNVIIQTTVNSFGSVAMAGIAAGSNYDSFIYTCTNAVAQTTMTFTSQNMGARKYRNIDGIYARCLFTAAGIGIGMGLLGLTFGNQIVAVFSVDADVIEIGAQRLRLIMPFYFFCSLMDVGGCQLRGMGRSFEPMVISLVGACGLRLLWIFLVFPLKPTLTFLYWSYPISWFATFAAHFVTFFIERRKLLRHRQSRALA